MVRAPRLRLGDLRLHKVHQRSLDRGDARADRARPGHLVNRRLLRERRRLLPQDSPTTIPVCAFNRRRRSSFAPARIPPTSARIGAIASTRTSVGASSIRGRRLDRDIDRAPRVVDDLAERFGRPALPPPLREIELRGVGQLGNPGHALVVLRALAQHSRAVLR